MGLRVIHRMIKYWTMTSLQLASMIARRTPWKTLSQLPMEDAGALCASLNQALQAWFEKASATHTSQLRSAALHGPVKCRANVVNGSSRLQLINPPAWVSDAIGSALAIGADSRWNRLLTVAAPSVDGQVEATALHAYRGMLGEAEVTLYHDCAPLGGETVSVCSNVCVALSTGQREIPSLEIPVSNSLAGGVLCAGAPERYQVEPLNPGVNSKPFFVLRVWPLPSMDVTLHYRVASHFSLSTADLQRAKPLPVPEDVASGILLPIALDHAAGQGLLAKDADLQRIAVDAAAAVARIPARTLPPSTAAQWMGTARGF